MLLSGELLSCGGETGEALRKNKEDGVCESVDRVRLLSE